MTHSQSMTIKLRTLECVFKPLNDKIQNSISDDDSNLELLVNLRNDMIDEFVNSLTYEEYSYFESESCCFNKLDFTLALINYTTYY